MRVREAWLLGLLACGGQLATPGDGGAGDDATACAAPMLACGAACVDPQTDDANCGGCGLVCATGCNAGRCVEQLLTMPNGNAMVLATDGVSLYWSTGPATGPGCQAPCSTLDKIPVGGGSPVELVDADPSTILDGPLLDGPNVYWLTHDAVFSMPLSGGPATPVVSGSLAPPLAVAGGRLVYVAPSSAGAMLATSPVGGGAATALESMPANLAWITAAASDSSTAYWGQTGEASPNTALLELPFAQAGGPASALATGGAIDAIALDASRVYYATGTALTSVPKAGGAATGLAAIAANPSLIPANLAVDDSSVYFTDATEGTLKKVPLGGGEVTTLVSETSFPRDTNGHGIAVDSKSVYWTTGNALMKVTPK